MGASLSVSIVFFDTPRYVFDRTLATLGTSLQTAIECGVLAPPAIVFIIANGPLGMAEQVIAQQLGSAARVVLRDSHGNLGYGRGNNLAIEASTAAYHLVLNPDVALDPASIANALAYLEQTPQCVCVTPNATTCATGHREYLAKAEPSVWLLALRGFAPAWLRRHFVNQLAAYELRDRDYSKPFRVPIASGAFMFCRTAVLKKLNGFDPAYFLYFEDFDLSRRLSREAEIHYVPSVAIEHAGGGAARKGVAHVLMFLRSARRYFFST